MARDGCTTGLRMTTNSTWKARHLLAIATLLASASSAADPIMTRDQNPFLTGFGLPLPVPTRFAGAAATRADIAYDWSSSGTIQVVDGEELVADAEMRALNVVLQHRFRERLVARVRVPWLYRGAGVLDSFIEDWHDALGFPQGSRRRLPHDQVLIGYARDGEIRYLTETSTSGLGDVALDAGLALHESPRVAASAWLSLKLPTGDASSLLGSGAVDCAATLSGEWAVWTGWTVYGQASYTYLGRGSLLPELQRRHAWSGLAGVAWQLAPPVTVKAQIDAHTGIFAATDIEFLGEAAMITLGVDVRPADRWQLTFAVGEDLDVKASPDVVFHFVVRRQF